MRLDLDRRVRRRWDDGIRCGTGVVWRDSESGVGVTLLLSHTPSPESDVVGCATSMSMSLSLSDGM